MKLTSCVIIVGLVLLVFGLAGCGSDGSDIARPDDQTFNGGDAEGGNDGAILHEFTSVRIFGELQESASVTLAAQASDVADSRSFGLTFELDGQAFPEDPGLGNEFRQAIIEVVAEDAAGNVNSTDVFVEFN